MLGMLNNFQNYQTHSKTQLSLNRLQMATNDDVVMVIETTRCPDVWVHYDLCLMTDSSEMARCKYCSKFLKAGSNSTLRKHLNKYCREKKSFDAKKAEAGESSGQASTTGANA